MWIVRAGRRGQMLRLQYQPKTLDNNLLQFFGVARYRLVPVVGDDEAVADLGHYEASLERWVVHP